MASVEILDPEGWEVRLDDRRPTDSSWPGHMGAEGTPAYFLNRILGGALSDALGYRGIEEALCAAGKRNLSEFPSSWEHYEDLAESLGY